MSFEVATVGDNCIDRYLPPVGLSTVGGNAVNVAVHLRRQGLRAAYFGAVGTDPEGERVLAALDAEAVATAHVGVADGRTAWTDIGSAPGGERSILLEEFGVCRGYRPDAHDVETLRAMRHVHIGWMDDGGALKRLLADAGVSVSQDLSVNADPGSLGSHGLAIAFASAPDRHEGARRREALLESGARVAVVTCGAAGSLASDGRARAETGIAATGMVDTLGAGDTFIAGFIAAHLRGLDLTACLEAGRDIAAATCGHFGGFPQAPRSGPVPQAGFG